MLCKVVEVWKCGGVGDDTALLTYLHGITMNVYRETDYVAFVFKWMSHIFPIKYPPMTTHRYLSNEIGFPYDAEGMGVVEHFSKYIFTSIFYSAKLKRFVQSEQSRFIILSHSKYRWHS